MLEVNRLVGGYGKLEVLHQLSLHVSAHEIVAVIGNNGAGKSTLLKVLMGLSTCWDGTIQFNDEDITSYIPRKRIEAGLYLLPEGGGIFHDLSIRENLYLSWGIKKQSSFQQVIGEVFDLFPDLKPYYKKQARTLSGGQRQMLSFGMALMVKPKLLMIDEPSIGLSPIIFQDILKKMHHLLKIDITLLVIEQNIKKILANSHRCYVINNGKIVLLGESRTLMNHKQIQQLYLGGQS